MDGNQHIIVRNCMNYTEEEIHCKLLLTLFNVEIKKL